jgi:hypothetical protein
MAQMEDIARYALQVSFKHHRAMSNIVTLDYPTQSQLRYVHLTYYKVQSVLEGTLLFLLQDIWCPIQIA